MASGYYDEWGNWIEDSTYTDPTYTDPTYTEPYDPWSATSWGTDTDGDGLYDYEEVFGYTISYTTVSESSQWYESSDPVTGEPTWYESVFTNTEYHTTTITSDPTKPDHDNDGWPDGWERDNGYNPVDPSDGLADSDGDGLSNGIEFLISTDYLHPDTDRDGNSDGDEVVLLNTDPLDPTDPLPPDGTETGGTETGGTETGGTETGGTETGGTETGGTETGGGEPSPLSPEWLTWKGEHFADLLAVDPEAPEAHAEGDADEDQLSNFEEFLLSTDPRNPDSDEDGLLDGWEVGGLVMDFDIEFFGEGPTDDGDGEGVTGTSNTVYGPYTLQSSMVIYDESALNEIGVTETWVRTVEYHDDIWGLTSSTYETLERTGYYNAEGALVFNDGKILDESGYLIDAPLPPVEPPPAPAPVEPTWTEVFDEATQLWRGDLVSDLYRLTWFWIYTDPLDNDSDTDTMPDGWEYENYLHPKIGADAVEDPDDDDLDNATEYLHGTDPWVADSDGDGLSDGDEVTVHESDPMDLDDPVVGGGTTTGGTTTGGTTTGGTTTGGTTTPSLFESAEWIAWITEKFGAAADPAVTGGNGDPDNDGLTNHQEYLLGTDPNLRDTDNDGLSDSFEVNGFYLISADGSSWSFHSTDPLVRDTDEDGLSDGAEFRAKSPPSTPLESGGLIADATGFEDLNNNNIPDGWEVRYGAFTETGVNGESLIISPFGDGLSDYDNDGLSDYDEYVHGTDPNLDDTDGDGLSDGQEVNSPITWTTTHTHTDIIESQEWDEVSESFSTWVTENTYTETVDHTVYTDPMKVDTDDDGLEDGDEILLGLNPVDPADGLADTDNDELTFAMEYYLGTNPDNADTDGDELPDGWEVAHGFDPLDPSDGLLDADDDGVSNGTAYLAGGSAGVFGSVGPIWGGGNQNRDTDGDGISDHDELQNGTDPFDPNDPGDPPPPPPCNP